MNPDEHRSASKGTNGESRRVNLFGVIVIALSVLGLGIYLVTDHWPHVLAALPYAAIIAVVGVHLLMHRGHGHGGHDTTSDNPTHHNSSGHDRPTT